MHLSLSVSVLMASVPRSHTLCDIFADPKPEPLIEPCNAAAIGQRHRHIVGTLQVGKYPCIHVAAIPRRR